MKICIFTLLAFCICLFFIDTEAGYVAAPLFSCVFIMLWVTSTLWNKDGGLPVFDIGFICLLATFIYSVVPLINFWVAGLKFGVLSDARLWNYKITPEEMGSFHWRHVLYLGSLAVSYVLLRKNACIGVGGVSVDKASERAVICAFLCFWLCISLLEWTSGFRIEVTYNDQDVYLGNFNYLLSMPYIVVQIFLKLYGIFFLLKLSLLFLVIQRCQNTRWKVFLVIILVYEIIYTFLLRGPRTNLVLLLLSSAMIYHRLMAPLRLRFIMPMGLIFLILFSFMGFYRSVKGDVSDTYLALSESEGGLISIGGEFQALLGTAYDVYQRTTCEGLEVPWYVYINDIINVLPPQQIMPFEKIPASEWYLRVIGMSNSGTGFMWGVITQCVVGLGWIELVLRGFILGFILAKIHAWYVRRKDLFLPNIVYTYLCLKSYYTFRDTTGALLGTIVWEILPFVTLLYLFRGSAKSPVTGSVPLYHS